MPKRRPPPLTMCKPLQNDPAEITKVKEHGERGDDLLDVADYRLETISSWSSQNLDPNLTEFVQEIQLIVSQKDFSDSELLRQPAELLPYLALGCCEMAMDIENLQTLGISAVVNCATNVALTSREFYPDDWKYLSFDAEDFPGYDILAHYDELHKFLLDVRGNERKCLIHCASGINRSATLAIAHVALVTGKGLLTTIKFVFGKRPIILSNEGFMEQLVAFAMKHDIPLK